MKLLPCFHQTKTQFFSGTFDNAGAGDDNNIQTITTKKGDCYFSIGFSKLPLDFVTSDRETGIFFTDNKTESTGSIIVVNRKNEEFGTTYPILGMFENCTKIP